MHGNQDGGGSTERRECQKAKLWRAVDDYYVVIIFHSPKSLRHSREKKSVTRLFLSQRLWALMLEFHQFDVSGNNIQPGKVCWSNDIFQRTPLAIVSDGAV